MKTTTSYIVTSGDGYIGIRNYYSTLEKAKKVFEERKKAGAAHGSLEKITTIYRIFKKEYTTELLDGFNIYHDEEA